MMETLSNIKTIVLVDLFCLSDIFFHYRMVSGRDRVH